MVMLIATNHHFLVLIPNKNLNLKIASVILFGNKIKYMNINMGGMPNKIMTII